MYCQNCGKELSDGSLFCDACGAKIISAASPVHPESVPTESVEPDLSLEESIVLADKLIKKYAEMANLNKEIEATGAELTKPLNTNLKTYSFIRFFWKWLVIGAGIFVVNFNLFGRTLAREPDHAWPFILVFILPIAVLILGAVISIKQREKANNKIADSNLVLSMNRNKVKERNDDLIKQRNNLKKELEQYNDLVPVNCRKLSAMNEVKASLTYGRAKGFKEAVRLVR